MLATQQGAAVKPSALKPRDPNLTAAVLRSRATSTSKKGGSSLSSLLQARSEHAVTKRPVPLPLSPLPDIDSKDKNNPLAAADYAHDIYSYYRRVEPRFSVPSDYMASQVKNACWASDDRFCPTSDRVPATA